MGITTSQPVGGVTRTPVFPGRDREDRRDRIEILANPIAAEDPRLARAVELEVRRQLRHEDVGPVEVRFRVCRDDADGLRFICKVENPPSDGEDGRLQWRWWSPLMETAEEFRSALEEGLRIRRARLSGRARTA
jgi:hypothetical protein